MIVTRMRELIFRPLQSGTMFWHCAKDARSESELVRGRQGLKHFLELLYENADQGIRCSDRKSSKGMTAMIGRSRF